LDKFLNSFRFGVGARTIELMLKNFPFAFRFGSRVRKLGEFIKGDKLNHDRSLFSQEEIDPDLIIEVRRGHEFLDAFERCYELDFRKKYKIVFFNEQGFEEEGIDGGGIIKEFINRVLK
jgi:ubiquitin-protein ligase E3 C